VSRAWLVRASERAKDVEQLKDAGLVGLRFEGVGDVRTMTPREVEYAIDDSETGDAADLRSRLLRFATDLRVGDLVVVPNPSEREFWLFSVTGGYEYSAEPAVPGFQHTRTVDLVGWLDRGTGWVQHKLTYLDAPAIVVELRDPGWWFEQVSVRDIPTVRSTRRTPPPPPPKPARAPRASAPKPPPKPVASKEPVLLLCAGPCGFQWRAAVLVDGLCPDCRGD
jgi:hypothetical protein